MLVNLRSVGMKEPPSLWELTRGEQVVVFFLVLFIAAVVIATIAHVLTHLVI